MNHILKDAHKCIFSLCSLRFKNQSFASHISCIGKWKHPIPAKVKPSWNSSKSVHSKVGLHIKSPKINEWSSIHLVWTHSACSTYHCTSFSSRKNHQIELQVATFRYGGSPPIASGTTCRLVEDPKVPLYSHANLVIAAMSIRTVNRCIVNRVLEILADNRKEIHAYHFEIQLLAVPSIPLPVS